MKGIWVIWFVKRPMLGIAWPDSYLCITARKANINFRSLYFAPVAQLWRFKRTFKLHNKCTRLFVFVSSGARACCIICDYHSNGVHLSESVQMCATACGDVLTLYLSTHYSRFQPVLAPESRQIHIIMVYTSQIYNCSGPLQARSRRVAHLSAT